jgi:predicted ATPase
MPTLDRIEIEGFKSIRRMALELRPVNVLIGSNGAGKSNFISAFTLLHRLMEGRLQVHVAQAGGADALLHFGRKQTRGIQLRFRFAPKPLFYNVALVPTATDSLFIETESFGAEGDIAPDPEAPYLKVERESESISGDEPTPETVLQEPSIFEETWLLPQVHELLRHVRVYHFQDTSTAAKVKQTQDLGDNEALRADASNLAALLFLLKEKHPDSYKRIVSTVRLAAPFFDDFRLRPSPFNEQKILLEWAEKNSDAYFNAHALSDGTLRFICLATLLLQPTLPPLIIIDEPELGLHPYAIQLLASLVRSASQKTQVILSTQSVTLVNQFEPEDLVVVERKEGASEFRRLSSAELESWLQDYSLGEVWEKNVFGGRPG